MAKRKTESEVVPPPSSPSMIELRVLSSTQVQNRFAGVLDELRSSGAVMIQRHDRPAAVLMSIEEFTQLSARAGAEHQLNMLTAEFDALVARLQTPAAAKGLAQAFGVSPAELAAAAFAGIRASMRAGGEGSPKAAAPTPRSGRADTTKRR